MRLSEPATHERAILFLKRDYWVLSDRVISHGDHKLDLHFHFDPYSSVEIDKESLRLTENKKILSLDMTVFAGSGAWKKEDGWVSCCYGEKQPAPGALFSAMGVEEMVTFMIPSSGGRMSEYSVKEVEAIGGRAFEVAGNRTFDIVTVGNGTRVEMARLASDFEWVWVRFSDGGRVPDEFVLVGGHKLELGGREILRSVRYLNYVVATRSEGQFYLKTDDGVLDLSLPLKDFDFEFSNLKFKT
jgi:hypothetical protein